MRDIENNIRNFDTLYSDRLATYFKILGEDKPMIGMSFHLYRYLGYTDFGNLEKQLGISANIGKLMETASGVVKNVSVTPDDTGKMTDEMSSILNDLEKELSTWRADQAKAGLEMIVAITEGDEEKFEELQTKLTFAQF